MAGFTRSLLEPGSSRTGTRMYQPPEASLGKHGQRAGRRVRAGRAAVPDAPGRLRHSVRRRLGRRTAGRRACLGLNPDMDAQFFLLIGDIRPCVAKDPSLRLGTAARWSSVSIRSSLALSRPMPPAAPPMPQPAPSTPPPASAAFAGCLRGAARHRSHRRPRRLRL